MTASISEAELVSAYLRSTEAVDSVPLLLHEFETLAGIPDVVLLEVPDQALDLHRELEASLSLTNGHASVLASLHRRAPRRVEAIVRSTGLAPTYVRRILADLRRAGLIDITATGSVRLAAGYHTPTVRFTTLEFKLTDWRRALAQALRHRSFAALAVVVMPPNREQTLRQVAPTFREYGVGSAVFDASTGRLKYVVKPRACKATSSRIYLDAVGRAASVTLGRSHTHS